MDNTLSCLKRAGVIVSNAVKYYKSVQVNNNDRTSFAVHIFCCRGIWLCKSIVFNCRNRYFCAVPILLRTLLELFVVFKLIDQDSKNLEQLSYDDWMEKKKFGSNLECISVAKEYVASEKYKKNKKEIETKKENFKKSEVSRSVADKFRSAGFDDLYLTLYSMCCSDSHNSISAVERMHLVESEDGCRLKFDKDMDQMRYVSYLCAMVSILVEFCSVVEKYNIGKKSDILSKILRNRDRFLESFLHPLSEEI